MIRLPCRIEMAARTTEEYLCVTAEYDRRDKSRERKARRYEVLGEETAIKNAILSDQPILPTWLNNPTYRQICRGYFLDYLANCPFEMHNLFAKNYLRRQIMELKPDQKIIQYLLGIKQLTPQQLAAVRGQTDRNIRKIRDRMLTRIQCQIIPGTPWVIHPATVPIRKNVDNKLVAMDDRPTTMAKTKFTTMSAGITGKTISLKGSLSSLMSMGCSSLSSVSYRYSPS